jgi:septum site-determining protein MinC
MTKIAIISQPEQGVLIDIGGCANLQEATQHLTSTLQVSSQFWENLQVDINLGQLNMTADDIAHILAILSERGVKPAQIFADSPGTIAALAANRLAAASGKPMSLPSESISKSSEAVEHFDVPEPVIEDMTPPPPKVESRETVPVIIEGTEDGVTIEGVDAAEVKADGEEAKEGEEKPEGEKPAAPAPPPVPQNLYLHQTLRSGQCISHKGNLIIIGDVNPGAEVMAEGDITIWGALRGIAHAGINGNTSAEIRALKFQPIQLRIAHAIARAPDRQKAGLTPSAGPETARIVNGTIRITSSAPE